MHKMIFAILATFLLLVPAHAGNKGGHGGKGGGSYNKSYNKNYNKNSNKNYNKNYARSNSSSRSNSRATATGGNVNFTLKNGGGFPEAFGGSFGGSLGNAVGCAIAGGCGGGGDGGVIVKTNVNVTINNGIAPPVGYYGGPSKDDVVSTGPIGAPKKEQRRDSFSD